jgi:FKBP12-rapamycin complex-associated protein
MDIILQLVRTEVIPEMRQECLRLLGNLGAIDSFNYKKILSTHKKGFNQLPSKFKFSNNYALAQ